MRRLAVLAGLAAIVLLLGVGAVLYTFDRFKGPGPLAADTVVYIPPGTGLAGIAERLTEAGAIDDPLVFRVGVTVLGATRKLKAGEYLLPATVSMKGVVDLLLEGKTLVRRLTVPEGATSAEAIALLREAEALAGDILEVPPEGSLLPETYHYQRGDSRAEMIKRMRAARDSTLADLWAKRAPDLPLATPDEAVILASIVEKETAVPEERPLVASVFVNRLQAGMRLQSDPTVVYGMTDGSGSLGRALTRKDLRTPNPYNTYLIDGLPPGPIANPGRASIEAALAPAQTEYLYFVADGNGGHAFAKTLEEHNKNVAKWRRIRDAEN